MTQLTNNIYCIIVPIEAKASRLADVMCNYHFGKNSNCKLLGTVTSTEIDFDVSGIVEKRFIQICSDDFGIYGRDTFKNYQSAYDYPSASDSFRSLIKSKGVEIKEKEKLIIIQKR